MRAIGLCLGALLLWANISSSVEGQQPDIEDSINVTIVGTLRTGLVAIGGETTGTTITANGVTWELDDGINIALRTVANVLNGKKVAVRGTLERKKGVEVKERWIVKVADLQAADKSGDNEAQTSVLHGVAQRKNTQFQIIHALHGTIIEVRCPFGIDMATITRLGPEWPKTILVHLHLKGLESFQARNGDLIIQWSVASTGNHSASVSLRTENAESPISNESPFFTELRTVGGDGKIPLQAGYFEVPLPNKLFEGNPREIKLRWIDFYRN